MRLILILFFTLFEVVMVAYEGPDNWKLAMVWIMKEKYWINVDGSCLPDPTNHIEMADRFLLALPIDGCQNEEVAKVKEQIWYMRGLTGEAAARAFAESQIGMRRLAWVPENERLLTTAGNAIVARIVKECEDRREGKGTI